ncbi:MAG: hypothetical protein Q9221_008018 [Calogaya cf. arnoldii]
MIPNLSLIALILTAIISAVAHDSGLDVTPFEHQARNVDGQQLRPHSRGTWLGWGAGIYNDHLSKIYQNGESTPPLVVDGTAYYPTWNGLFVALDYANCKVLWQTNITTLVQQYNSKYSTVLRPISRTTPALYKNFLFIGTQANALLLAINRRNGKLVDTIQLLWSQPMIPAGLNYTGAAIWGSQPAIDPKRNLVFIATGNVYSTPESYEICSNKTLNANITSTNPGNATDPRAPKEVYQEAILAFDTATGDINWSHQLSPIDAWNVACREGFPGGGQNPSNCPPNPGPDADFAMAPTFVPGSNSTPTTEDTLIIGQKNGNIYALSASDGKLYWATATSPTGYSGGLMWGVAVDDTAVYYTAANSQRLPWKLQDGTSLSNSAFGAAGLKNDTILWETPSPGNSTTAVQPTVVNDVVLVGVGGPVPYSGPGTFLALDKYSGEILRETKLDATYFQAGIAVIQDYVMFGTGYGVGFNNGSFNVWRLSK